MWKIKSIGNKTKCSKSIRTITDSAALIYVQIKNTCRSHKVHTDNKTRATTYAYICKFLQIKQYVFQFIIKHYTAHGLCVHHSIYKITIQKNYFHLSRNFQICMPGFRFVWFTLSVAIFLPVYWFSYLFFIKTRFAIFASDKMCSEE